MKAKEIIWGGGVNWANASPSGWKKNKKTQTASKLVTRIQSKKVPKMTNLFLNRCLIRYICVNFIDTAIDK